ncbi:MAG: hypothetical protein ABI432_00850 [Flavobacteriales bacterium]
MPKNIMVQQRLHIRLHRLKVAAALLFASFNASNAFGQDSLITLLARSNVTYFGPIENGFSGIGWDRISTQVDATDNVLIGEDHFTNEIPAFVSALAARERFDNFFCEVDPFSARILQERIESTSAIEREDFLKRDGDLLSFFAFVPEYHLLEQLSKANTRFQGLDQILMVADGLVFGDLATRTTNKEAKGIYLAIRDSSRYYFEAFKKDPSRPMYSFTPGFDEQLAKLSVLDLSKEGSEAVSAMAISMRIYKEQSHPLRMQLLKNDLMRSYSEWKGQRNLFKFGAYHMPRGEGLIGGYDIGNLVSNLIDGEYKRSYHLMIAGRSGMQASPLECFPETPVDENSEALVPLRPFFNAVLGTDWHCFDLAPLKEAMEKGELTVPDPILQRIIKGYDHLVIIPVVSAPKFVFK